jgi:hypothetical protein
MFFRFGITRLGGNRRIASNAKRITIVTAVVLKPIKIGPDHDDCILTKYVTAAPGMRAIRSEASTD